MSSQCHIISHFHVVTYLFHSGNASDSLSHNILQYKLSTGMKISNLGHDLFSGYDLINITSSNMNLKLVYE